MTHVAEETKMTEVINHPVHYAHGRKYEPIDVIESWGLGFSLGNAVKYIARTYRKSDPLTDLRKARWYLDRVLRRGLHEVPDTITVTYPVDPSYARKFEIIDVIEDWGLGFSLGNALLNIADMYRNSDPMASLQTAAWFLDRVILQLVEAP